MPAVPSVWRSEVALAAAALVVAIAVVVPALALTVVAVSARSGVCVWEGGEGREGAQPKMGCAGQGHVGKTVEYGGEGGRAEGVR